MSEASVARRVGAARRAAEAAGYAGIEVRACGHDTQVAAVRLAEPDRARALEEGLPDLAEAIRTAGFRYVAIELDGEG